MKKKVLVLGAGEAQLALVQAGLELGYEVVVCDRRPEMASAKLASIFYPVDYMDRAAILDIARRENVDGVVTNSEPAVLNTAYLSEHLGLPGNSMKSMEMFLSKAKFRALQKRAGVFAPDFVEAGVEKSLLAGMRRMRYPVIIKPCESSGTRGTTKLTRFDEEAARAAFRLCQGYSRNGNVSVEEYVEAQSLAYKEADIFVIDGEILWDGWFGAFRSKAAPMLPMASVFPMDVPDKERLAAQAVVEKIIRESGVQLGEFNVEAFENLDGETFVIEINPRQGGNYIPQLIQEHCGVDLTKLLVSTAVGDMRYSQFLKTFQRENHYIVRQSVFSYEDGIYEGLYIAPKIAGNVKWIKNCVEKGDRVFAIRNAEDAVAYVNLEFETPEAQRLAVRDIEKLIYPLLQK